MAGLGISVVYPLRLHTGLDFKMRIALFILVLVIIAGCATEPTQSGSIRLNFSFKRSAPSSDSLYPIYPNPFSRASGDTSLVLQFALRDSGSVALLVQNALGDAVASFSDLVLAPGLYSGSWNPLASDGTPVMTGIYFVTLHTNSFINSSLVNIQDNE